MCYGYSLLVWVLWVYSVKVCILGNNLPSILSAAAAIAPRLRDRQNAQPPPSSSAFSKVDSEGDRGQPVLPPPVPQQQLPPPKERPPRKQHNSKS